MRHILAKRQNGRYYTEGNPFTLEPFRVWARKIRLDEKVVLEPYAGANNIIRALQAIGYAQRFASFDIHPEDGAVAHKDTIRHFPKGFEVCVTNPPWLAKNSAHRRGLSYPETQYDDLYKYALHLCLENCSYVAALIPATFLQSRLFFKRLDAVAFLHDDGMFTDTDNPVCLALFTEKSDGVSIFFDSEFVGNLVELEKNLPSVSKQKKDIIFNDPRGGLGFIAFDNTHEPSIRFCHGEDLSHYTISHSSRMITRISGDFRVSPSFICTLNAEVARFRDSTKDVFLTPFKGLRKDGKYRRRMDYQLARNFISTYA